MKNAIVEYLDYQIPVTQLNGDLQAKARLKCATYRRYTDLSVMGVRVGVANSRVPRLSDTRYSAK